MLLVTMERKIITFVWYHDKGKITFFEEEIMKLLYAEDERSLSEAVVGGILPGSAFLWRFDAEYPVRHSVLQGYRICSL